MDYIPPLNKIATVDDPRPAYDDGDRAAGRAGSKPSGKALEIPMREILAVIEAAGLTPNPGDPTQLWQAIMILAAGAGATAAVFAYNPVFPHVTVNGGVISISSSNGQIVVNSGQTFIHRGGRVVNLNDFNLAARTFPLVANKTYHLRWRYNGGSETLAVYDLTDAGYNPLAKLEADASFDTGYDDALFARVVTDGSNNVTVTALKNLAVFPVTRFEKTTYHTQTGGTWVGLPILTGTVNWARTPRCSIVKAWGEQSPGVDSLTDLHASATRYAVEAAAYGYGNINSGGTYQSGAIAVDLAA